MSKTLNLKIVGEHNMHCAGCERSVTFTISQMAGVDNVLADWTEQSIKVDYSSDEINLEKIQAELDWIGYQAVAA